jgi:hypothetical protein
MILEDDGGRAMGDLQRWAKLVVDRHEAGRSIKNADDWLGAIMVGVDEEYLD